MTVGAGISDAAESSRSVVVSVSACQRIVVLRCLLQDVSEALRRSMQSFRRCGATIPGDN